MKLLKNSLTTILFSLLMVGFISNVQAQDKRAAIQTYNDALELAQSNNFEEAIEKFNTAIAQAEALGEEGQDIMQRAEDKLPQIHYQLALKKYKTFQSDRTLGNMEATIDEFQNTQNVAEELGSDQISQKANGVITQLMYNKGLLQYQQGDLESSLATLDEVIERNANYSKAYYQKALVIKKMDARNLEEAISQFDRAIEVAEKVGENDIVTKAQESAREELVYRGSQAIEEENFDRAIELLNRALNYDSTSANAYYRLAEAHNKLGNWEQAIEHAQQGLEYESGGRTDQAKIYFELATAYQGIGQKENACSAFSNAAYGSFKSPAEHAMEYELKCENMSN